MLLYRKILRTLRKCLGSVPRGDWREKECEKNSYKSQNKCMCLAQGVGSRRFTGVQKESLWLLQEAEVFDEKINNSTETVV